MEDPNWDDDGNALRQSLEYRKQKRLAKQERLQNKEKLIQHIRERLEKSQDPLSASPLTPLQTEEDMHKHLAGFDPRTMPWAYQVLGVPPYPSAPHPASALRTAYYQRAKMWHPDHNKGTPALFMQLLNAAWDFLKQKGQA